MTLLQIAGAYAGAARWEPALLRRGRAVAGVALATLLAATAHAQTPVRVVHETFSGPTGSMPPAFVAQQGDVLTDTDGTRYVRYNWDGRGNTSYTAGWIKVPGTGPFLVRMQVMSEDDIDHKQGSKMLRIGYPMTGMANAADFIMACQYENGEKATWWIDVPGGGGPLYSDIPCRRGWHDIAVYQSSTVLRLFIGGKVAREWKRTFVLTGDGRDIHLMSNWSNHPQLDWGHDAVNHFRFRGTKPGATSGGIEIFTEGGVGTPATGRLDDNTASVGGAPPPPPPPPPTDCKPGTPRLLSSAKSACENGTQTITETWTRDGDVPATPGGAACSPTPYLIQRTEPCDVTPPPTEICGDHIDNDGDGLIDEGCPPPPVSAVTASTTTETCRLTITAQNVESPGSSWRLQLLRRRQGSSSWSSHGNALSGPPYTRTVGDIDAAIWETTGEWRRSGRTPVPLGSIFVVRCGQ